MYMDPLHPPTARQQHAVLLIVSLGAFMVSIDATIVNIALPSIAQSFGIDMGLVSWVIMVYLLILISSLTIAGKLGDIKGFRYVFSAGCIIFITGSVLCGISATFGQLICFRALQGIGAAALYAIGPAMIAEHLPARKRGWALGIMTTIVSVGVAIGPLLGGFITEYANWNLIFFVNVPVGILVLFISLSLLPSDIPTAVPAEFDLAGAVLIFFALLMFLFPVNRGLVLGWTSPAIIGTFTVSLVFFFLFFVRQHYCRHPIINMRIFKNRAFLAGNLIAFLLTLVINGAEFLFPFFFENVQGLSPAVTGILLAVPAVTLMVTGPVAGSLSDRYSPRILTTIALTIALATFVMFSMFDAATAFPFIIAALALEGIAIGLYSSPNTNQILSAGSGNEKGLSSSVMMTIRHFSSALGVAIFGSAVLRIVFGTSSAKGVVPASVPANQLVIGFQEVFLLGAILVFAALVLAVVMSWGTQKQDKKRGRESTR
ncbi:MAG: MFS transporter [Methanoregula sp.]|nr:MAG: MFS transporter [Methanoregula sp.]